MSALLDTLARMVAAIGGKKVAATLVALVAWVGGRLGLELPIDVIAPLVGILVAYVLSQGVADVGKERAKIETQAAIQHGVTSARVEVTTIPPPIVGTPAPVPLDQIAATLRQEAHTVRFNRPLPPGGEKSGG